MKPGVLTALAAATLISFSSAASAEDSPLQILVITSGCCHDYPFQTESMQKALASMESGLTGFDEVEISDELAERQPEADWQFRADWKSHDYQARMRG